METHHPWNLTPQEAIALQEQMRSSVVISPLDLTRINTVCGLDTGIRRDHARATAVLLSYPSLEVIEEQVVETRLEFPYIPGLLSFREAPAYLAVLEKLHHQPDLIMVDGHGYAHPRRFGITCHVGVLADTPSIGCAKSILVGRYEALGETRGSTAALVAGDEVLGMAVRTRDRVKPVFVSIGHLIDIESAVQAVLACGRGYRLPEPTRLAHHLASRKIS